ncbi:MAG: hypothetical protein ACFCU7_05065 [Pleurocapsa sp.]
MLSPKASVSKACPQSVSKWRSLSIAISTAKYSAINSTALEAIAREGINLRGKLF